LRLVVDSSVVLEVVLSGAKLASLGRHDLHAPALLPSEVTSALHELRWRGVVPADRGAESLAHLRRLPIEYAAPASLVTRAWAIADDFGWAKSYDAEYVALAEQLDCPLVTLDARLRRGLRDRIRVLGPTEL
jgi:predicted nucleic acid-binding protein